MDALYRNLLDNLFDGIYFVDRKRTITYWNRAAETITGFSADEVVGTQCFDNILRHVDDAGTELCIYWCLLVQTLTEAEVGVTRAYPDPRSPVLWCR